MATDSMAPPKPMTGFAHMPMYCCSPVIVASATPKEAPPDIPRVYGSAIGFRSIDWSATPQIPKELPTRKAMIVLGILIFFKTSQHP